MAKKIPRQKKAPVAKGKLRRTMIEEDEAVAEELTKKMATPTGIKADRSHIGKGEIGTQEVINVMADEIEEIYAITPFNIDRSNAEEKARTILIALRCHTPTVSITEHEYDIRDCGRHDAS
jgi:hypothetical protein